MSRSRSTSTPRPVHSRAPRNVTRTAAKRRREEARQHGRHVLDHALLGLDQPGGDEDGPGRSARQQPRLDERLGVDPDALEHHHHERREDAAAEGDQHVVDEELAREADEVHAALDLAPAAAGVRDAHDEPERDRQVQRRERLGGALRLERIDVGEHGRRDERQPPANGACRGRAVASTRSSRSAAAGRRGSGCGRRTRRPRPGPGRRAPAP